MFFTEMNRIMNQGVDITLIIRKTGGNLTVSTLPKQNGLKDEAQNLIIPLTLTGTAEELDAGFFQAISQPVQKAAGLLINLKAFEEQAEKAAENSRAAKELKEKQVKAEKEKKEKFDKLMKKADELEKEQKHGEALVVLKQAEVMAGETERGKVGDRIRAIRIRLSQGSLFGSELMPDKKDPQVPDETNQDSGEPTEDTELPAIEEQKECSGLQPVNRQKPDDAKQEGVLFPYEDKGKFVRKTAGILPEQGLPVDYSVFRPGEYDEYPDFPEKEYKIFNF